MLVPRQRKFYADLAVINECLDGLIARAKDTRQAEDIEALQARDYSKARCAPCDQFVLSSRHKLCPLRGLHGRQSAGKVCCNGPLP